MIFLEIYKKGNLAPYGFSSLRKTTKVGVVIMKNGIKCEVIL